MQLFVRGFETVEALEVLPTATIAEVKAQIAQAHGLNTEEITLNCEGNSLCNDAAVTSLASFELDITVPMLGGKVHGSLARAGKVKGQTPKVEKQEKKKKKTGRAKRRIQYNRRFVNIVQGFGRRRGPNANSN
ncbi:FAU ubiquitin-like and ribosomal protein S30 [Zeugodacus cucurbitae]|uniref:40S ribosomal protein S30 n=1 Tax=Zeugodacus cucurbitae TaxID=28588 RepID=A0A0A1WZZ6_ZEUCU|nr:FAU ubiquitin-like and ribosomal protein S30 [Zeugodacus cucurbitae]